MTKQQAERLASLFTIKAALKDVRVQASAGKHYGYLEKEVNVSINEIMVEMMSPKKEKEV